AAGAPAQIRKRKDVSKLNSNSPEILALQMAVTAMKALAAPDGRNWLAQAKIHGTPGGDFGLCQHGNWFFLPWHRAYLYYFEEIVRELSRNEDFALPYWDWSKDHSLPALFW